MTGAAAVRAWLAEFYEFGRIPEAGSGPDDFGPGVWRRIDNLKRLLDQPPAPAPSDEVRERLEEIATWIEASGSLRADHEARFLRNLASREHRGEEERIAKLEALGPNWDSYGGKAPTDEALGRLRGFDRALAYVPIGDGGIQVEFHALGLDFEAVINPAGHLAEFDLQPPAGEIESLREALTTIAESEWVGHSPVTACQRVAREALGQAPSDSQGD